MNGQSEGKNIYKLVEDLYPICRSITGNGVRESLQIIKSHLPNLKLHEVPTGKKCFDWTIPDEWNVNDAYVKNEAGEKIIDFKINNLHLVNYSIPINEIFSLEELDNHLHSLPNQPDLIPYITSYYEPRWGFCIPHNLRKKLPTGNYTVHIDTSLKPGSLTYADLFIQGKSEQEILISTYICHPSLANNELSGPALATFLAKWVQEKSDKSFSYRFIFVPETIGAVAYLSKNIDHMKKNTIAGYVLTCVGDNRSYSFMPSRAGNTLADKVALHVLNYKTTLFKSYSYLERGSDERQYCAPGVDLPVCSVMRTKYGEFPEYHTSNDNLDLISSDGFQGSYDLHVSILSILERNKKYITTNIGEPQLGRRNLRSNLGGGKLSANFRLISNFIAYADGNLDLIDIANILNICALDLLPVVDTLLKHDLIRALD